MPDFDEINASVIAEYRANGGALGGPFAGETLILLHHIGAKSGVERVSPLAYVGDGDRIFVIASKAGLPENPAWYHNLLAHPDVTVELGAETFPVRAFFFNVSDSYEIYSRNAVVRPQFADYQANVERVIPVVELVRR